MHIESNTALTGDLLQSECWGIVQIVCVDENVAICRLVEVDRCNMDRSNQVWTVIAAGEYL